MKPAEYYCGSCGLSRRQCRRRRKRGRKCCTECRCIDWNKARARRQLEASQLNFSAFQLSIDLEHLVHPEQLQALAAIEQRCPCHDRPDPVPDMPTLVISHRVSAAFCRRLNEVDRLGPRSWKGAFWVQHGADELCSLCAVETDGYGFPHPSLCRGRLALRACPHCSWLVRRADWDARARCCLRCAEPMNETGVAV